MRNTVNNALNSNDFRFDVIRDNHTQMVIRLGIGLSNGKCDTFIDIRDADNQVLIFTVCPMSIPEAKRGAISEYLTRANHELILGNFELNFKDGEVRYKCTFIYEDGAESETIFMRNLYASFHMMDRYLPGIMAVVYANVPPAQAIAQIENSVDPSTN
jgi:hypothetical protein